MAGEIARTFLESCGLHTVLFDADTQGYLDGLSMDVRLMGLDEDWDDARVALDEVNPAADAPPGQD